MVQYPDCPFCGNSNSALSVVDVEMDRCVLKAIQCNSCKKYFGFFKDYDSKLEEIKKSIESLESEVTNLCG